MRKSDAEKLDQMKNSLQLVKNDVVDYNNIELGSKNKQFKQAPTKKITQP